MRSLLLYIQVNSQTMSLRERERERERERCSQSKQRWDREKRETTEIPWCCLRSGEQYVKDRGGNTLQAKVRGTYHCYSYGVWIVHLYFQFRILTLKLIDGKYFLESSTSFKTSTTSSTLFYPHDSWHQNSKWNTKVITIKYKCI